MSAITTCWLATAGELPHLVVRPFQELFEQAKLAQQLERRGMNRVAAEVAEEVRMLLEHLNFAASARK